MVDFFLHDYEHASAARILLEFVAFVLGILSVVYAKRENILVYPTGLIATVITTYLLWTAGYLGDMLINAYFSIMSIYGWYNWSGSKNKANALPITRTNTSEKLIGVALFLVTVAFIYGFYTFFESPTYIFDYYYLPEQSIQSDNYIDIFASGLFFTAMWYMALKKIENWTLWIIGDLVVTPLYAYRGLGMLSLQYLIFTILAVMAYLQWKKTLNSSIQTS